MNVALDFRVLDFMNVVAPFEPGATVAEVAGLDPMDVSQPVPR